jgi:hypothetical protein
MEALSFQESDASFKGKLSLKGLSLSAVHVLDVVKVTVAWQWHHCSLSRELISGSSILCEVFTFTFFLA